MAQTGYTPIQLYRSTTGAAVPLAADLAPGELGFNIADTDMALYAENASGTVKRIINNPAGLKYPTTDGTSNQAVSTDGSGTLSFSTFGYINIPQSGSAKTTSYALATTDIGKVIEVGTGGSITVPDATFAAGDVVIIFNNTASSITMTMTITNAYIAGTDADKATISVATRGVANVLFVNSTTCVVTGNVS